MVNFDSSHSFIDGNLNDKKGKKTLQKLLVGGLIVVNLLSFSGCSKTFPCDVKGNHAHYYINGDLMGRYINSEKSYTAGLLRTDDYVLINREEEQLLKFINKNNLFEIESNKSVIADIVAAQEDYTEYRYSYIYSKMHRVPRYIGDDIEYFYWAVPTTGYSWTKDSNYYGLTGEERVCHYVYYGYEIIKNEKGKYELVKSEPVDSLDELPEGFNYVREKFYDIVNLYNKDEILDYEDGPSEDKEIVNEEEYTQSQSR